MRPGSIRSYFFAFLRRHLDGASVVSIYGFHDFFMNVKHFACVGIEGHDNANAPMIDCRKSHDVTSTME
jgi:hypothetical protein